MSNQKKNKRKVQPELSKTQRPKIVVMKIASLVKDMLRSFMTL
jgi:hypothetical protein